MILAVTLLAFLSLAAVNVQLFELKPGDEAAKKAYFASKCYLWGTKEYRVSPDKYNAVLIMSNDKVRYAFHLAGKMVGGKAVNVEVGMIKPSHFQWYAGGFFKITSGKKNLSQGSFAVKEIKSGAKGEAVLEYSGGALNGRVTLTLHDNDDKLGFLFTPADKKGRYMVALSAYPGHYGTAKLRKRVMYTNLGKVQGNVKRVTPQDHYAVFGDEYYDRAHNRGDGCCAFLYNPKQVLEGSSIRSGYGCTAYLYMVPGAEAAFVFWDFKGKSLQQALEYMKTLKVKFD